MMELKKEIIEVIENNGFYLTEVTKQSHVIDNEQYYVELQQGTPAGEDWWITIWFDGTSDGFVESVRRRSNDFDVDEEVEVFIEGRGKNGIPSSIRTLIEDAEWKEEKLEKLADDLENIWSEEEDECVENNQNYSWNDSRI